MKGYLTLSFNKKGGVQIGDDVTVLVYKEGSKIVMLVSALNDEIKRIERTDAKLTELLEERNNKTRIV